MTDAMTDERLREIRANLVYADGHTDPPRDIADLLAEVERLREQVETLQAGSAIDKQIIDALVADLREMDAHDAINLDQWRSASDFIERFEEASDDR